MSKQTVKVPDLGGASDVDVIEICVASGDVVTVDQSLIVVESDKASMDIPSPVAGTIIAVKVAEGASVSEGDVIADIEVASAADITDGDGEKNAGEAVVAAQQVVNEASDAGGEPSSAGGDSTAVLVPDLGGADQVEIIEISVAVGDTVGEGDALVVMESDKASMDLPSPQAGVIKFIHVKEGDTISQGDLIVEIAGQPADLVAANGVQQAAEASSTASAPLVAPATEAAERIQMVTVPDLGGADKVELIEVLVAVGDRVSEGDGLVVMESDKASMELPSPFGGTVEKLYVKEGDSLAEGGQVVELSVSAAEDNAAEQPAKAVAQSATAVTASQSKAGRLEPESSSREASGVSQERRRKTDVYAGPAVRKLARELGVDLSRVTGSGPRDRITKENLYNFVKQAVNEPTAAGAAIPKVPAVDFSQFGEVDIQPMSKLHKLTAANMHRSWLNVPHVTQFDEADITELEAFRQSLKPEMERRAIKLTPVPFIMKAVAAALRENPAFNASLGSDGESIIYKKYCHVGMAVDTPAGLMVPVIRDVDQKGIWELAVEILALATKAKDRKLSPADMQGGCFTISSLGSIGGTGFTPIVNTPEVGILGVSKLSVKPVYVDGQLEPRKMLPLSLSYDHRAVNGGDAGRFFTFLSAAMADIRRLVL